MALLVPNVGEIEMLARILGKSTDQSCVLRLYSNNNLVIGEETKASEFDEISSTGYTPEVLDPAEWGIGSSGDNNNDSIAIYNKSVEFILTGPSTIYGYYVTDAGGNILLWAEEFMEYFNIPPGGGIIKITPRIQLE